MNQPIGIIDSGSGGLYILKYIKEILNDYSYTYLGDHKNSPYGNQSFEKIYEYTLACVNYLSDLQCPLILFACNTTSAKALRNIQQLWIPTQQNVKCVLGIIIPTAEEVGLLSTTQHVGVLATEATVISNTFLTEIHKIYPNTRVFQQACPTWVGTIENLNDYNQKNIEEQIKFDIDQLLKASNQIDTIILGCTHYPLIQHIIQKLLPPHITIINQGKTVSEKLSLYLQRHPEIDAICLKEQQTNYLTTGESELFRLTAHTFLGIDISPVRIEL